MKIVVAQSVQYGREAFAPHGEVVVCPDGKIDAATVRDADALVIRSKTRVNRALLDGSRVAFAGTATAGFDHIDTGWMEDSGRAWMAAAGCNANSVAEYLASALLALADRYGFELAGRSIAVVGVGQVGRRVVAKSRALGLEVRQNDPPRRLAEEAPELEELDAILPDADIVTLHVPLTDGGPFATRGMVNARFLERMKPGAIFVNASRGEVVREDALLLALESGRVSRAVLDVWDDEPNWSADLAARVDIATPHIAGYSFDGKLAGTVQVYEAFCRFFEIEPVWTPDLLAPAPALPRIECDAAGRHLDGALWDIVRRLYDVTADDRALREGVGTDPAARAERFEACRKKYWMRREFQNTVVALRNGSPELSRAVAGLGFKLDTDA